MLFDWLVNHRNGLLDSHLPIWILWRLWKSRNKLVFQQKQNHWRKDYAEAARDAKEWIEAGLNSTVYRTSASNLGVSTRSQYLKWKRPREGWIKCNYDCSFLNAGLRANAAWIIRDNNGVFKGAGQAKGLVVRSALEAECQSLLMAVQNLWIRGYRRVSFEGDCQTLMKLLHGKVQLFDCINWIVELKAWALKFEAVEFVWASRRINKAADVLVKDYRLDQSEFRFHSIVHSCIAECLRSDMYNSY